MGLDLTNCRIFRRGDPHWWLLGRSVLALQLMVPHHPRGLPDNGKRISNVEEAGNKITNILVLG